MKTLFFALIFLFGNLGFSSNGQGKIFRRNLPCDSSIDARSIDTRRRVRRKVFDQYLVSHGYANLLKALVEARKLPIEENYFSLEGLRERAALDIRRLSLSRNAALLDMVMANYNYIRSRKGDFLGGKTKAEKYLLDYVIDELTRVHGIELIQSMQTAYAESRNYWMPYYEFVEFNRRFSWGTEALLHPVYVQDLSSFFFQGLQSNQFSECVGQGHRFELKRFELQGSVVRGRSHKKSDVDINGFVHWTGSGDLTQKKREMDAYRAALEFCIRGSIRSNFDRRHPFYKRAAQFNLLLVDMRHEIVGATLYSGLSIQIYPDRAFMHYETQIEGPNTHRFEIPSADLSR